MQIKFVDKINKRAAILAAPVLAVLLATPVLAVNPFAVPAEEPDKKLATSTADHSKFEQLQRDFKSGPEITKACLSCHTEAAKQVQATKHWTWEFLNPESGQRLGKKNVINNFCTAVPSNYEFCTACHVGYGWKDQNFDFSEQTSVDCLVCHDTTGKYRKLPGFAGHPVYEDTEFPPHSGKIVKAIDLTEVAQSVGKTSRTTCGTCHFYGGGGDGVKHGDMDSSLEQPQKYLDIHMSEQGHGFSCGTCHMTSSHNIPGSRYTPTAAPERDPLMRGREISGNPATCQACHGSEPHSLEHAKLNSHTRKIACQTCHIPQFARGDVATKMSWDWSTAGELDDSGKPYKVKNSAGYVIYDSKKGTMTFESHVIPTYIWFNGTVNFTLRGDKVDPDGVVKINSFEGSPYDGESKIWPVKVFKGKQPYDKQTLSLLIPHTYGADESAYWTGFDWPKALKVGMESVNDNFSGEFGFVATEMTWPITHMVAPEDDALRCTQCHSEYGRLQNIEGIYMPGRDGSRMLNLIGWSAALLALIGVMIHGGIRIWSNRK